MIKIVASYGLKIPADEQYSSESFHATTEVELADSLVNSPEKLKAALRSLWADLKAAVAEETGRSLPARSNGNGASSHGGNGQLRGDSPTPRDTEARSRRNGNGNGQHSEPVNRVNGNGRGEPASRKQVGFILALSRRKKNLSAQQAREWLRSDRGLSLNDLTKQQAAQVIDELNT